MGKMCDRGLPEPNLVCYLEVCVETVMNRAQWGESRYDEKNFQFKVKENFNRLRAGKWVSFKEGRTIDEIQRTIF